MVKDIQLFGRLGNKTNDIKFFVQYLPKEINKVIEPFGGTFAVSRICYRDDKYKKIVNDNDKTLYSIYTKPEEYAKLVIKMNNHAKNNRFENSKSVNFKEFMKSVENDKTIKKDSDMFQYYKKDKVIRGSLVKVLSTELNFKEQIKFMKKIKFTCSNYLDLLNSHYQDENAFIFLDPPYLFSDNSQYLSQNIDADCTDILCEVLDIFKNENTKAKIMLIINDMKIIRYLFKNYVKDIYERVYQLSKKKTTHLIITNY